MVLALAVFTFSCSNDNTDVIPEEPESTETNALIKANLNTYAQNAVSTDQAQTMFANNDDINDALANCFTLNFPYTLTNGQDSVVVNTQEESDTYESLGYFIEFPVDVTTAAGVVTITNELEFIELLEDCFEDFGGDFPGGGDNDGGNDDDPFSNDCFEFNFPLSVTTVDGNTVVVNDEFELFTVEGAVGFVYPISVTTETATGVTVVTINSDQEFDDLYNECYDIDDCDDCFENCFEIVYPLTLVDETGNLTTVNDDDAFIAYLNGLANDAFFTITFPMNIEYEDGTPATINSEDELIAAFDACDD